MKMLRKLSLISLLAPLSVQAVQIDISIKDKETQKKIVYAGLFGLTATATSINLALLVQQIISNLKTVRILMPNRAKLVFTPQTICMSVVQVTLLASLIYFSIKMYKYYLPTTQQKFQNRVKYEVKNIIAKS